MEFFDSLIAYALMGFAGFMIARALHASTDVCVLSGAILIGGTLARGRK